MGHTHERHESAGRIFVSQKLLQSLEKETLEQTADVATLPGIQKYAIAEEAPAVYKSSEDVV